MGQNTLLEIENLRICIDADGELLPIVDDISLTVKEGEILALVGESGCGKSVTAQSIMRLLPKTLKIESGQITLHSPKQGKSVDITGLDPRGNEIRQIRGEEIAMIFQEPMSSFSPLYTIGNQVGEVVRIHRKASKKEARAVAVDMLNKGGNPGSRSRRGPIPARTFRRHASTRDDRQGVVVRSGLVDRRRTDHRTGRDHPGPGAVPDA